MGFFGDVGNFFGTLLGGPGGPTTTQKQTGTQQQQQVQTGGQTSTSTVTPNLPGWYNQFLQGIPGMYAPFLSQLQQQMQTPLYGPQQQANFQQQLGQQYGQANQNLLSSLASRGALNSGAAAQAQTQLGLGQGQQLSNYLAQVPLLNRQAQAQAASQYGGALGNLQNFRIPFGQTTTGSDLQTQLANMFGQSTNQITQQQTGGLLNSLLGGALGTLFKLIGGGGGGVQNIPFDPSANPGWEAGAQSAPPYTGGI